MAPRVSIRLLAALAGYSTNNSGGRVASASECIETSGLYVVRTRVSIRLLAALAGYSTTGSRPRLLPFSATSLTSDPGLLRAVANPATLE
jgi:hypothetical protein